MNGTFSVENQVASIENSFRVTADNIPGFVGVLTASGDIDFCNQPREPGPTTAVLASLRRGGDRTWNRCVGDPSPASAVCITTTNVAPPDSRDPALPHPAVLPVIHVVSSHGASVVHSKDVPLPRRQCRGSRRWKRERAIAA